MIEFNTWLESKNPELASRLFEEQCSCKCKHCKNNDCAHCTSGCGCGHVDDDHEEAEGGDE